MPSSSSIHQQNSSDNDDDDFEIVERDPTGRYVRYSEVLGEGSTKTVYKAFDEINGTEVAWNQINLSEDILNSGKHLERICSEAHLLKTLKHDNVIRCFHSWIDTENKTINMITELFTSGNLRLYRGKHGGLNTKAIKKWAVQILRGLDYLHSQNPPIVHRDLRCDNIFVNGNSGNVKIGDLGLATVLQHGGTAHSVIGMPEFMAPELYEEEYDQKVDIYSFGMCMLQMVTRESPYCECKNPAQVFKKVTSGVKPESLRKVTDARVKKFIEKCLAWVEERPSASDLLNDPFLDLDECSSTSSCCSSPEKTTGEFQRDDSNNNELKMKGEMKEGKESVSMTLLVPDLEGEPKRVDFVFFLGTDTVVSVTEEMVNELGLSSRDANVIAELMAGLISEVAPGYYHNSTDEPKKVCDQKVIEPTEADLDPTEEESVNQDQGLEVRHEEDVNDKGKQLVRNHSKNEIDDTGNLEFRHVEDFNGKGKGLVRSHSANDINKVRNLEFRREDFNDKGKGIIINHNRNDIADARNSEFRHEEDFNGKGKTVVRKRKTHFLARCFEKLMFCCRS